jgi:hypothetical protein
MKFAIGATRAYLSFSFIWMMVMIQGHQAQTTTVSVSTLLKNCALSRLTSDINRFISCTTQFKTYCSQNSQDTCHQMLNSLFAQSSTFSRIINCAPWKYGMLDPPCLDAIAAIPTAHRSLASSWAGAGLLNNPSITTHDPWRGFLRNIRISYDGVGFSGTVGYATKDEVDSACILDSLPTNNDLVSSCSSYLLYYCSKSTQADCHIIYAGVFSRSSKFSSLIGCSAWQSGPRSTTCQSLKNGVIASPVLSYVDKMFVPYITDSVLANPRYAPCNSTATTICRW